jgi:3-keto-5-aminohexanoate cleavage enzyme
MIMVAPTGARGTKADHPGLPLSPGEIADEVARCAQAGASIAHLHARAPDGSPTQAIGVYREIVERIRERCDIVLQISLGTRGFTPEQAIEPVSLKPEMVSLPLDAFQGEDTGQQAAILDMARRIRRSGVRPEMSVYNERMLDGALGLVREGTIQDPACFGLILRDPVSMQDGAARLMALAGRLPGRALWWIGRGGRHALGLRALAAELGGHLRVGFEDSVMDFDQSRKAESNAYLVERAATLCAALGRRVASAAEARAMITGA